MSSHTLRPFPQAVLYEVFSAPDGCAAEEEKADILDRYFDPDFIGQVSWEGK